MTAAKNPNPARIKEVDFNQPPAGEQRPKTFLIGTIKDTQRLVHCCPHASSLLCQEIETAADAIIAIPCRRWGCRYCGVRKCFQLAARVEKAQPTKFITLTTWTKNYLGPRDAYDRSRRKVAEFAKVLRRQYGSFEYLRVLEQHQNGFPHYHFAARSPYIPQAHLANLWAELSGNIIVHIKAIEQIKDTFRYMMKYLCKQTYIPWTNRRVSWSKEFFPKPEPNEQRQNPFIRRRRSPSHPADVMATTYADHIAVERRPGVWVLLHPNDPLCPPMSTNK